MNTKWISVLALAGFIAAPAVASTISDSAPSVQDEKKQREGKDKKKVKILKLGSTVPEAIKLTGLDGKDVSFKDLRGKVAIVHFWSDRCPAERHANPIFLGMEKKYAKSKDVVMIGIAANQNELGDKPGKDAKYADFYKGLRKKRDSVGYKHTILADHGNVVSTIFGARTTPHCYVIDKKGVIQYVGALDNDPRGKKGAEATNYLVDAATAILADKKPTVQTTKPYG
jgi:thiol-disulfide isomerase/thioredoxin